MANRRATKKKQAKRRAEARRVKSEKEHQISLCMIVKNEEEFLPGCLDSVKGVVDEIVIVDTGSTDRTVEIARQYGAKVYHYEWNDDFAAARNESLKHATCGWILVLDADERLDASSGPVLRAVASGRAPKAIYGCWVSNRGESGKLTEHVAPRFFPGGGAVAYEGFIHEQPRPVREGSSLRKECPVLKGFVVTHVGYQASLIRERNKRARNISLLERALAREDNAYQRYKLGATLLEEGCVDRGVSELEHALTLLAGASASGAEAQRAQIRALLCRAYLKSHRVGDALACIRAALEECPDFKAAQFQYGLCLAEAGEIAEARDYFTRLALVGPEDSRSAADALSFDPSIFTWKAKTMAARCSLRMGDARSAARMLAGAAGFRPRAPEYVQTVRDAVARLRLQGAADERDARDLSELEDVLREEARARLQAGDERFDAGEIGEALRAYRDAVQMGHPVDGALLARLASCEARLGGARQAFTTYLNALRARPSDARSVELLIALTRLFQERMGEALRALPERERPAAVS